MYDIDKPLLLDLYCGAGGASVGYHRAGFEVVGVDLYPQPNYPFPFVQMDALAAMSELLDGGALWLDLHGYRLQDFDLIHASPPCQAYTWAAKRWDVERADLVEPTRELLERSGRNYVIENVPEAPLIDPIRLCGVMFDLEVIRHRNFEANWPLSPLAHVPHKGTVRDGTYVTVAGHGGDNIKGRGSRADKQRAMGIDWMTDKELNESIPPAYTQYVGEEWKEWRQW